MHTAPGHGQEDYLTGLAYDIEIYAPVDNEGKFIPQVDRYAGLSVFQANPLITADMKREGTLLKESQVSHSYPHCWRCKNPVIFRATSQWFISMDAAGLRARALEEIGKVHWIPPWGEERMAGMVAARPDWCISRQRMWGVPIPAFECRSCGEVLASEAITLHVADIFGREGSNSWFVRDAEDLVPSGTKCPRCGSADFVKESNILDVWFESGASHAVLGKRPDLPWPADVYIEGTDQYRGWFNSSLLVGVGAKGGSPYKTCITHGFVLDEQGRAMSKSLGNVIEPEDHHFQERRRDPPALGGDAQLTRRTRGWATKSWGGWWTPTASSGTPGVFCWATCTISRPTRTRSPRRTCSSSTAGRSTGRPRPGGGSSRPTKNTSTTPSSIRSSASSRSTSAPFISMS